jgi:hypothetical protein
VPSTYRVKDETMQQTQLRTTQLGATGLEITRIGFRRADQVDPILTAASIELTGDEVDEIEGR